MGDRSAQCRVVPEVDCAVSCRVGPRGGFRCGGQYEGLEFLRRIGRHVGDEGSSPLIVDLQARVAVIFDGWAKRMVSEGRTQALRDTLVYVVGEEYADTLMASLGPAKPEQSIKLPQSTERKKALYLRQLSNDRQPHTRLNRERRV